MIRVRINIVQHTQCSNMTSMTQQENLIRGKPGHRIHMALKKLKKTFDSRQPLRRTILKDKENKCIVATKQHRGVHKDKLHQRQNSNSLRDTGNNTTHMVFEGERMLSNFTPRMSRLGLAQMETRQDQVTMGRVHSPASTNH